MSFSGKAPDFPMPPLYNLIAIFELSLGEKGKGEVRIGPVATPLQQLVMSAPSRRH